MDFGIAYRPDSGEAAAPPGTILGTPAYIAPEQAVGASGAAAPAGDQYSLGAVFYELLCGRPPFCGPPSYVLFHAVNHDPPDPREIDRSIPRPLAEICRKAMAKRPERRYPSCQAFAADLKRWLKAPGPRPAVAAGSAEAESQRVATNSQSPSCIRSVERAMFWGGLMNESDDSGKAADMAAGCTQEIPTRGLSRSAWPSTKLLVVDDSEFEHQVIAGLLRGVAGLNVDYVSGGAAALEAVERETPDLILTDLFMPDMDGLELVQKVRSPSAGRAVDPDDGLRQRGRGHPVLSGRRGELSPQEGPGRATWSSWSARSSTSSTSTVGASGSFNALNVANRPSTSATTPS